MWCLSSDPTGAPRVCSGSWDSKIKLWDLQGQNVEMTTIRYVMFNEFCFGDDEYMKKKIIKNELVHLPFPLEC